jgi:hypothetical protein
MQESYKLSPENLTDIIKFGEISIKRVDCNSQDYAQSSKPRDTRPHYELRCPVKYSINPEKISSKLLLFPIEVLFTVTSGRFDYSAEYCDLTNLSQKEVPGFEFKKAEFQRGIAPLRIGSGGNDPSRVDIGFLSLKLSIPFSILIGRDYNSLIGGMGKEGFYKFKLPYAPYSGFFNRDATSQLGSTVQIDYLVAEARLRIEDPEKSLLTGKIPLENKNQLRILKTLFSWPLLNLFEINIPKGLFKGILSYSISRGFLTAILFTLICLILFFLNIPLLPGWQFSDKAFVWLVVVFTILWAAWAYFVGQVSFSDKVLNELKSKYAKLKNENVQQANLASFEIRFFELFSDNGLTLKRGDSIDLRIFIYIKDDGQDYWRDSEHPNNPSGNNGGKNGKIVGISKNNLANHTREIIEKILLNRDIGVGINLNNQDTVSRSSIPALTITVEYNQNEQRVIVDGSDKNVYQVRDCIRLFEDLKRQGEELRFTFKSLAFTIPTRSDHDFQKSVESFQKFVRENHQNIELDYETCSIQPEQPSTSIQVDFNLPLRVKDQSLDDYNYIRPEDPKEGELINNNNGMNSSYSTDDTQNHNHIPENPGEYET